VLAEVPAAGDVCWEDEGVPPPPDSLVWVGVEGEGGRLESSPVREGVECAEGVVESEWWGRSWSLLRVRLCLCSLGCWAKI
jgi:hypothetical protein